MTWPRVILLAIITGVYTAVVKLIPFLDNTSFQDIAIYLDFWFLFAIFIVVNCQKWYEASLKCFVFFLISQPLIFLIQVPFYDYGWEIFRYYPRWFYFTLLTLPGAAIAFLLKKKNWLSVAVLSVATVYLSLMSTSYFKSAIIHFPYHLLSGIFALALIVFFVFVLLDERKHRLAALIIAVIPFIIAMIIALSNLKPPVQTLELGQGEWTCTLEDSSVAEVEISEGNQAIVTPLEEGTVMATFRNADGEEKIYYISISGSSMWISPYEES